MTEFIDLETQDGVRLPWNIIPGTKPEASSSVVPISVLYTPLKPLPNLPLLPHAPLRCRSCRSVLNPFSVVDFSANIWLCPFCFSRNPFPPSSPLPHHLPSLPTSVEYLLPPNSHPTPPTFLFVVDLSISEEDEMGSLKRAVQQGLELVPEDSLVGVVTFGKHVQVHELGFLVKSGMQKSFVFKGGKEVSKDEVIEQLGFFGKAQRPVGGVVGGVRDGLSKETVARFLLPVAECGFALDTV